MSFLWPATKGAPSLGILWLPLSPVLKYLLLLALGDVNQCCASMLQSTKEAQTYLSAIVTDRSHQTEAQRCTIYMQ